MIPRSQPIRFLLGLALLAIGAAATHARAHPQDGPHADVRATIDDAGVRLSVGTNVAFIDYVIGIRRESLEAIEEGEGRWISAEFTKRLLEDAVVEINGQRVQGVIDSHVLFTTPEPSLAVIYPRMGMRALMRATTLITYPLPEGHGTPGRAPDAGASTDEDAEHEGPLSHVAITWPYYPPDILAAETEGATELPPRVINILIRAEGETKLTPFSEPEPTFVWTPGSLEPGAGYIDVPAPPEPLPPGGTSYFWPVLGACLFIGIGLEFAHRVKRPTLPLALRALPPMAALGIAGLHASGAWSPVINQRDHAQRAGTLSPDAAAEAFAAVHSNLYQAFGYTSEEAVYDALARSIRGPLLPELYDQVYQSLVQADQGGLEGIITAYEPRAPEVLAIEIEASETGRDRAPGVASNAEPTESAGPDGPGSDRFGVTLRQSWTIDGTIYHWGHSHTAQTEYTAEYRMTAFEDGWRLTDQRITEQRVTSQPGAPPGTVPVRTEPAPRVIEGEI